LSTAPMAVRAAADALSTTSRVLGFMAFSMEGWVSPTEVEG
jgi:hypothetical protein